MGNLVRLLFLATAVVALVACGKSGPKSVPKDAVAVVGDQVITKKQFNDVLAQAKRSYVGKKTPFPKPGTSGYAAIRSQVMTFLVEKAMYFQKAKDEGVEVSDKAVSKKLEQIKKQFFSSTGKKPPTKSEIERRYKKQLEKQHLTDQEVREGIRYQLVREEIAKKVTKGVKVSGGDVKKYYEKNKTQFQQAPLPESRDVRHILVKTKALANRIYGKLKSGADFVAMVNQYSTDTSSKPSGGKLTICRQSVGTCVKTVAPFEKAAFALKKGQISRPVHTQFGWHIIQALSEIKPPQKGKATPLSQVKEAIRQQLLTQKRQDELNKWWEATKKEFNKKISYQTGYKPAPQQTQTSP
ncbi:MAG: peptidylprolyl isomerase [Actinomycetota bacterium]|nr:peptidylprolyl isomerase [Actinomycetota bacterium]